MADRRERFEVRIDASPEEVWRCLTTSDGLASWFGTGANIDTRVGGARVVEWGDAMNIVAKVTDLETNRRIRLAYLNGDEEVGAEEWLIETEGTTTRLTLIHSMSDQDIDDWDGFYGDVRRGWRLFMASLRYALESAESVTRTAECRYVPAPDRTQTWNRLQELLAEGPGTLAGLSPIISDPPHSLLLTASDRTLMVDLEGSGANQVLFIQAATHGAPDEWRSEAIETVVAGI